MKQKQMYDLRNKEARQMLLVKFSQLLIPVDETVAKELYRAAASEETDTMVNAFRKAVEFLTAKAGEVLDPNEMTEAVEFVRTANRILAALDIVAMEERQKAMKH